MALTDKLIAIGDSIRKSTGKTDTIPLSDMPDEIEQVYDTGRKSQYDEFWDSFQNNGKRTDYRNAFYSTGWTDTTFKPKYSMKPSGIAQGIFQNSRITDLQGILEEQGVTLDFSACTNMGYGFYGTKITHIGVLDTTSMSGISEVFTFSYNLQTIDLIKLKSDGSQTIGSFSRCDSLKNIAFEGVIGTNASFSDSPLSKKSITNIINALSSSASGKTLTLKKSAVNNAFGIDVDNMEPPRSIASNIYDTLVNQNGISCSMAISDEILCTGTNTSDKTTYITIPNLYTLSAGTYELSCSWNDDIYSSVSVSIGGYDMTDKPQIITLTEDTTMDVVLGFEPGAEIPFGKCWPSVCKGEEYSLLRKTKPYWTISYV